MDFAIDSPVFILQATRLEETGQDKTRRGEARRDEKEKIISKKDIH